MAPRKPKRISIPKTTAQCADLLYELREQYQEAKKYADACEEQYKDLKKHLIEQLESENATGVSGNTAKVSISIQNVASVEDWNKLYAFIKKNNRFDFLQRRVADKACRDYWEEKRKVPGVSPFPVSKLSVRKI